MKPYLEQRDFNLKTQFQFLSHYYPTLST